jgi:hypothetical protein
MILDITPFEQAIIESALKFKPYAELVSAPATRRQIRDTYRSVLDKVKAARKGEIVTGEVEE